MKPQPLKGKEHIVEAVGFNRGFNKEDVAAAVEWLKEQLRLAPIDNELLNEVFRTIDEAFVDVVKEEELK